MSRRSWSSSAWPRRAGFSDPVSKSGDPWRRPGPQFLPRLFRTISDRCVGWSASGTRHPGYVVFYDAIGEAEPCPERPDPARRAGRRRAHIGPRPKRTGSEHVVYPAQCALTVGRPAGGTRHVDRDDLALAPRAGDKADWEIVCAPQQDQHARVVPAVDVQGRLARPREAGHRRVALASAHPALGRTRRLPEEHDLQVGGGAVGHDRLVVRRPRREGEDLAPNGNRLRVRIVGVLVEDPSVGPSRRSRSRCGEHLLVVRAHAGLRAWRHYRCRCPHDREDRCGPHSLASLGPTPGSFPKGAFTNRTDAASRVLARKSETRFTSQPGT